VRYRAAAAPKAPQGAPMPCTAQANEPETWAEAARARRPE